MEENKQEFDPRDTNKDGKVLGKKEARSSICKKANRYGTTILSL